MEKILFNTAFAGLRCDDTMDIDNFVNQLSEMVYFKGLMEQEEIDRVKEMLHNQLQR